MTQFKKVTAVLLSLLMMLGAFSVLGSAVQLDQNGDPIVTENPATIDIGITYVDAGGNAISDMGAVAPGSTIKARVSLGTNYYTNGAILWLYYPTAFFSDAYSNYAQYPDALNSANASVAADKIDNITIMNVGTSGNDSIISVSTGYSDNDSQLFTLDGTTWLFEIELTVNAGATGVAGLSIKASDFEFDDVPGGVNDIEYGSSGDPIFDTMPLPYMNSSDFQITIDYDEVTTGNSVTFNACGGVFASNNEETLVVPASGGVVGQDYDIPVVGTDFDYDGYTFLGWYEDAAYTTPAFADGATRFEMPVAQGVVYYAKWNKNVTISFADTGDNAVADQVVSGGTAWDAADKPTVTKQGYKFMGWSGEGVVNGELPDNYPAATAETDEFTYTATWAKYLTITFDANGGTFTDGNTGTYSDNNTIYGGAAWDTSVVPKYDVSNYSATGISRPGYALLGWNDGSGRITQFPATYPDDNVTYTAVWQAYNVYVTYIVDGNTVSVQAIPYSTGGLTLRTVADVAEWHYNAADGTTYAPGASYSFVEADINGITFYGVSEETGTVTATFNANGGKFADDTTSKDVETAVGATPVAPANPTREGYSFIGWTPAVGTIADDTTYTAVWSEDSALVIYLDYDGTEIERFTQAYGEDIEAPADPEREGYTFTGWDYVDSDDNAYTGTTVPAGGLTATAQYTVNTYKITYDVAGGVYDDSTFTGEVDGIAYQAAIPAAPAATKEGYKAPPAWTYADANGVAYTGTAMPAFDLYATAVWEVDQFTITFVMNGGDFESVPAGFVQDANNNYVYEADYNSAVTAPATPVKAGQSFAGWYEDSGFNSPQYQFSTMPADNITLYAKWGNNIINIKFMDGDTQLYTLSDEYGENVDYSAIDTDRAGYTFDKWYDTATFDNAVTLPATYPATDLTVYGKWIPNEYTITYEANEGTWAAGQTGVETITYDTLPTLPTAADITREGYSFGGVYLDNDTFTQQFVGQDYSQIFDNATLVADNRYEMTVYIKWNINSYNAVFYSDGQAFRTVPYNFGAPVSAPVDEPVKDGYSFKGWAATENATPADVIDFATAGITMPVGGLAYYAVFERNAVTVNFYAYGEGTPLGAYDEANPLTGSGDYDIGADLDLADITAPEYPNFVFVGWTCDGDDYSADEIVSVEDAMNFYAVYQRVAVKLVPTDSNSTAMIERDGVVETYNTGLSTTPYGVTEIKTPDAEAYSADSFDAYYVYGLNTRLTEAELADYVKVQGDGHYEITLSSMGAYGTGAIIEVIDNVTGQTVEQFRIVIFGDLNGDALITTTDTNALISEVKNTEWSGENKIDYLVKAADLNLDGLVTSTDTAAIINTVKESLSIDQRVGLASA